MLLRVSHLTKRYGSLTALSDVSFSIRRGEVLGLIGPNGSGKTTLFECLGGVLPADSGAVHVDDRSLSSRQLKARLFYLHQGIMPFFAETPRFIFTHPAHPPLVPVAVAWSYLFVGRIDEHSTLLLWPAFYASLVLGFFAFARLVKKLVALSASLRP